VNIDKEKKDKSQELVASLITPMSIGPKNIEDPLIKLNRPKPTLERGQIFLTYTGL